MMKQGVNLVGKLAGVVTESWERNGLSGVNVTIGITRTYTDRFGADETETFGVDVRGASLQSTLREQAERYRGKIVSMNVRVNAYSGKSGPFVKFSAVPDTEIVPLLASAPAVKTASA